MDRWFPERRYYTGCLLRETAGTPLIIGSLSPGMVATDMLTRPYEGRPEEWERVKKVFNLLADRIETVTPWMAAEILQNKQTGKHIHWLTKAKLLGKLLAGPFRKQDLFQ